MFLSLVQCKANLERTKGVLQVVGLPWLINHLYAPMSSKTKSSTKTKNYVDADESEPSEPETLFTATEYCFQTIFNTLSGAHMTFKRDEREKYLKGNEKEIDAVMTLLLAATLAIVIRTGV